MSVSDTRTSEITEALEALRAAHDLATGGGSTNHELVYADLIAAAAQVLAAHESTQEMLLSTNPMVQECAQKALDELTEGRYEYVHGTVERDAHVQAVLNAADSVLHGPTATLWVGRTSSSCSACHGNADPGESGHFMVSMRGNGCGARFVNVAASYVGTEEAVAQMRPDLPLLYPMELATARAKSTDS